MTAPKNFANRKKVKGLDNQLRASIASKRAINYFFFGFRLTARP